MSPHWPFSEDGWPRDPWRDDDADADRVYTDEADELLARRVADRFVNDPDLRSGHVVITVQNRVVILKGRVDSPVAKDAASRQAWATPGVFDVCNRLLPA